MTQNNQLQNFAVLSPYKFLEEVEHSAAHAKQRVWMQAMYVDEGLIFSRIQSMLRESVQRHIDTRLHADWFCLKFISGKRVTETSQAFLKKKALFEQLQQAGVSFTLTNLPNLVERVFPYKGRNHMKITIIDEVAYLGGVNFADSDFEFADFMVRFTDSKIVEAIAKLYTSIETRTVQNESVVINHQTKLLIDRGSIGHSVILNHAVKLARSSKESIDYTCQFFPDGPLLSSLHRCFQKKQSIRTICPPHNAFSQMFIIVFAFNRWSIKLRRKNIPIYILNKPVHAKLLIVDKSAALFGSHNLTRSGVIMGTGEVALQSTNPELVANLQAYFDRLMQSTQPLAR